MESILPNTHLSLIFLLFDVVIFLLTWFYWIIFQVSIFFLINLGPRLATRDWMSKVHRSCGVSFFQWYYSHILYVLEKEKCISILFCFVTLLFFINSLFFIKSIKSAILIALLTRDNGVVYYSTI